MKRMKPLILGWTLFFAAATPIGHAEEHKRKTENVVIVMIDGLRWEEIFRGAEEDLLNHDRGGVLDEEAIKSRFWRTERAARREALMPSMWTSIAKRGQLFGNRPRGSNVKVTNGVNKSYPGYHEALCGFVDSRITSNSKIHNPNATVLEWLNGKPEFQGQVAAFTSWEVFPYILNTRRSGLWVDAGVEAAPAYRSASAAGTQTRADALTFHAALTYLKEKTPRLLFVCLDETDEEAHAGRYDRVLSAAHQADAFLKTLWETLESLPFYHGKTTLIVLPDHGRGHGPTEWRDHGEKIDGADNVWMAFLGPDTPAKGERENSGMITESQLAATIAGFLGMDYCAAMPCAAKPIRDVIGECK